MVPQPPPGQGPIDPRGAFSPPPAPGMPGTGQGGPPGAPTSYPPPGPMYPPPMMMMPPGMFPPQRSFARTIFTTLATAIFGLSVTLNLYLLLFSGLRSGLSHDQTVAQTVVVEGDPTEKVAVIPITGMILEGTAERFNEILNAVEKDPGVKAIVLDVDTPGGGVTPSDEIHARLDRFRAQNPKRPIVVSMGGMATSGGYYVSANADYIFAQPTTLTGNIGVLLPRYNFSKLAKSYGVEEVTVTAPHTGFKNAGSPFLPVNPDDDKYLHELIDSAYAQFTSVVQTGRKGKLKGAITDIANGKAYTATQAIGFGLVDEIGYRSDAYDKAAKLAGLSNKHVVKYAKPASIFDFLSVFGDSKSNVPGRGADNARAGGGVTINGVNVNVDANLLDELARPRLMYLWRGQ